MAVNELLFNSFHDDIHWILDIFWMIFRLWTELNFQYLFFIQRTSLFILIFNEFSMIIQFFELILIGQLVAFDGFVYYFLFKWFK